MSRCKWFGNDVSNRCSLFDNGLLIKRESKGWYKVCAFLGNGYAFGMFWLDAWEEDTDMKIWNDLGSSVGISGEQYKKEVFDMPEDERAITLLTNLMQYIDVSSLLGWTSYEPKVLPEKEIRRRLNKVLKT